MSEITNATENENWLLQLIDVNTYKIKVLEQRVQTLESENQSLKDEVAYFNLIFPTYADAINILKKRLDTLESKL